MKANYKGIACDSRSMWWVCVRCRLKQVDVCLLRMHRRKMNDECGRSIGEGRQCVRVPIIVPAQTLELFKSLIEFLLDIDQCDVVGKIVEPRLYLLRQFQISFEDEPVLSVLD